VGGVVAAAEKAMSQYGFITTTQAERLGVHPNTITRLVQAGHWVRVRRGLYQLAGANQSWRGRMMAATLQAGDEALISHRSAAALWGLEGFEPPWAIDVTVPSDQRPRINKARVHRRTIGRRAVRDGIPVTPIPETILDLCAVSRHKGIPLRALDDVRRRKLVRPSELERCLEEHAPQRLAGIPLYRELLERRLGKTPPGTVFAAEVLDLLVAAGLPEPVAEFRVTIDGRWYRIDLAYPRPKVAIECLGKIGHLNERAFEEDPVRNNDFAIDGWLQLQVTYRRQQESPASIIAEVDAALACRGGA
jgi:Transcriptional regulator, AbiEi antitoxin